MYRCSVRKSEQIICTNLKARSLLDKAKHGKIPLKTSQCYNSTRASGGSGFYVGATATTLGALIGGTTAYAGHDIEFRRSVEDAVPFSKTIFKNLLGEIKETNALQPIEKDLSIPFEPEPLIQEETAVQPLFFDEIKSEVIVEEEKVAVDDVNVNNDLSSLEDVTTEEVEQVISEAPVEVVEISTSQSEETEVIVSQSEAIDEATSQAPATDTDERVEDFTIPSVELGEEKPLTEEEIETLASIVDKEAMEVLVSSSSSNIEILAERAANFQREAAKSLREYMKAFASLMNVSNTDENFEAIKQLTIEAEHQAQERVDTAKREELSLFIEIESLHNLISTVREGGVESKVADDAEIVSEISRKSVTEAISEIDNVQKDFDFLMEYQNFVTDSPSGLHSELNKFAIDVLDLLEKKKVDISNMTRDQAILALALERQQMYESEEVKKQREEEVQELLQKQKDALETLAEEHLVVELKKLENEKDLEREASLKSAEEAYEKEMLAQLKRQASAHNEHLAEELAHQARTLNDKHQIDTESKLDEQHKLYYIELEKKVQSIGAIQSKINDVVDVETRQRQAQELWIASQAINGTLTIGTLNGRTRSLMPDMISVLQLGERNTTLAEIVDSFPEQAALFGVVPEKDLINRFKRVKDVCKKVAAVNDGDSIGMYLLSYIKSVFVFSRWYLTDANEPVNVDDLTSYEILAKAEHFIQQGDLETAAKLMGQLKGVARKMCVDWLNEVRLLLETKQTATLLQAYAASLTAGLE